jgi:hypothetical protein
MTAIATDRCVGLVVAMVRTVTAGLSIAYDCNFQI